MVKKYLLLVVSSIVTFFATAQNVGIGTTTPLARLHVADSAVLFSGATATPPLTTTINPPIQGSGSRMMWFPALGAFRAGYVDGVQWDRDSIGSLSFATGYNTMAKGKASTSLGAFTTAVGDYSTSLGFGALASGLLSISMGNGTIANDVSTISMGTASIAQSPGAISIGSTDTASGLYSIGMGYGVHAIGDYAVSIGRFIKSKAYGGMVIGMYNDITDTPLPSTPSAGDRVFQIGNGTSGNRTNAITILRNGNTGIGTVSPNAPLQFANVTSSRKIVLWEGANDDHQFYGFGVNGSSLRYQISSSGDDHIFYSGAGASSSAELLRIKGNGNVGIGVDPVFRLDVGSRMRIRSGGDNNSSAGIWFNNNANDASPAFIGMESNDGIGFYGSDAPGGWGLVMKTSTGNIGIGMSSPGFPLNFPNTLGDKISLYGNSGSHYGFGIQGSLLQVHSSGAGDDIAFGYGSSASFTERARIINSGEIGLSVTGRLQLITGTETAGIWFKNAANSARGFVGLQSDTTVGFYGNNGAGWGLLMNTRTGAFSISGSQGLPGQVLTSNGLNSPAIWSSPTDQLYNNTVKVQGSSDVYIDQGITYVTIPGLNYTFTTFSNAKIIIHYAVYAYAPACPGTCSAGHPIDLEFFVNGTGLGANKYYMGYGYSMTLTGTNIASVPAGTHTINVKAKAAGSLGVYFGTSFPDVSNSFIVQVISQ